MIPKPVRDAAGLEGGSEIEVEFRDGRIEIEPARVPMKLIGRGARSVIEASIEMPVLSVEEVRETLEHTRR